MDFSSTQIPLPEHLSHEIVSWGKKIPNSDLDPVEGRENDIHITILYGIHSNSPEHTIKLLKDKKSFKIKLGKMSIFENQNHDVLKIDVISKTLDNLNKVLKQQVYTSNHNEYIPHVTIAYLKNGKGKKYDKNDLFEGREFIANKVIFSSVSRQKTSIPLQKIGFKEFVDNY